MAFLTEILGWPPHCWLYPRELEEASLSPLAQVRVSTGDCDKGLSSTHPLFTEIHASLTPKRARHDSGLLSLGTHGPEHYRGPQSVCAHTDQTELAALVEDCQKI